MKKFLFIFFSVGILQQTYTMEKDDIQKPTKKAKYEHNPEDSNRINLNTALINAINNFDKNEFYSLLEQRADINACGNRGETPLYIALTINHSTNSNSFDIEDFLKRGANPNVKQNETSLLNKAVELGNIDSIKLLIKYGAKINKKDFFGGTPLRNAILGYDGYNDKVIEILCNMGAKLTKIDDYNKSNAFHTAIKKKLPKNSINLFITNSRFDVYNKEADKQLKTTVKIALLIFNRLKPTLPKEILSIIFSHLALNCLYDSFNKKLCQQLVGNKNAKNPLLAYTLNKVNCLEQILQSKNDKNKTALEVLRDRYKNDPLYIQEVESLVDVNKLQQDRIDFMNGTVQGYNSVVQIHKHAKNLLES